MRRNAVPIELILSRPAKQLCSAIYVSGRETSEAIPNSVFWEPENDLLYEIVEIDIDDASRTVSLTVDLNVETTSRIIDNYRARHPELQADWNLEAERLLALGSVTRKAKFCGDQGSIILPVDGDDLHFTPIEVQTSLPDASDTPWPLGDALFGEQSVTPLDQRLIELALDAAFEEPEAHTAAFIALHRGQIVAERYAPGFNKDTQLESWSMGKSLTATLVGLLIHKGELALSEPAPIPEWQQAGDRRKEITVADLLRMSSGLKCSSRDQARADWEMGVPDHNYVYHEAIDVFQFMTDRPAEHPPNTVGRYRNCDPLLLGKIVKQKAQAQGEDYLTWPQENLFDHIGIRKQVLETDLYGNFILTGFDFGTARNWARLGQLYLQDGVWNGKRLLPEGWSTFVSTPAPAWAEPIYGGQFWLNADGRDPSMPRDAYYMGGRGIQRVAIIPSLEMVVVRLGHLRALRGQPSEKQGPAQRCFGRALELLGEAVRLADTQG